MTAKSNITPITVASASYVSRYLLSINFSDGRNRLVDFEPYFNSSRSAYATKYKQPAQFRKFLIQNGNLVWGRNWDLVFPPMQLYRGRIKL